MCSCSPLTPYPYNFNSSSRGLGLFSSNLVLSQPPWTTHCRIWSCYGNLKVRSHMNRFSLRETSPVLRKSLGYPNYQVVHVAESGGITGNSGAIDPVPIEGTIKDGGKRFGKAGLDPEMAVENSGSGGTPAPSSLDFLELKRELEKENRNLGGLGTSEDEGEEELILPGVSGRTILESEEEDEEESQGKIVKRRMSASGRQTLKRSNLLAKQVISIRSACSVGFISQLWVDTKPWLVVVVEVRPSILSGESEKFFLEDICQVGDMVLIEDESLMESEVKLIGLDTLVGYNVVTSDRRNLGKVRDYNFNINTGAVESLEFDPFGLSIIPASLVSTYSLFVEDIIEVLSDKIVVHDDTMSRVQRLTKGFWDTQTARNSENDIDEFSEFRRNRVRDRRRRTRFPGRRKVSYRMREIDDDWDLPMEY